MMIKADLEHLICLKLRDEVSMIKLKIVIRLQIVLIISLNEDRNVMPRGIESVSKRCPCEKQQWFEWNNMSPYFFKFKNKNWKLETAKRPGRVHRTLPNQPPLRHFYLIIYFYWQICSTGPAIATLADRTWLRAHLCVLSSLFHTVPHVFQWTPRPSRCSGWP